LEAKLDSKKSTDFSVGVVSQQQISTKHHN